MARENFSIGAFYNITKNQDNPIKTVGQDSFLRPKTPKNTSFLGVPQPQGSHSRYILGDTTRPRHITCPSFIEIGSKTAEKNSAQANKRTDRQTDKPTDTTKIMVTWPQTNHFAITSDYWKQIFDFLFFSITGCPCHNPCTSRSCLAVPA